MRRGCPPLPDAFSRVASPGEDAWPQALCLAQRTQGLEIGETIGVFMSDALLLSRPAHRCEVAEPAGVLVGCRGEESAFDGSIDNFEHLQPLTSRVVVDRNRPVGKAANRSAEEQPALGHFFRESLL